MGLARSGVACANLLYELGAQVVVSDHQDNEETRRNILKLKSKKIEVELGRHTQGFIKNRDLVVISPGVPMQAVPVRWAGDLGIPVISEIELAWLLCPATIIAVTGSNGKTTVTTLIGRILEAAGKKVFVCGNIGSPFSAEVEKMQADDFVSLEVSSFQMESIQKFKPKISVILNFSPNHLDRYHDLREYLEAKKRIFMNQDKTDYLVLNYDDPVLRGLAGGINPQTVYFSGKEDLNPNQAAVLAVGSILRIDAGVILSVLKDFKGIEHRMEYVSEINRIKFINDSKSTTTDSALWALRNILEPVILIAGGKDKGLDYSVILDLGRKKIKEAVLIGEAAPKIEQALTGSIPVDRANSLEEAVKKAYHKAEPGDCVLLSPMCSSFDMFSNYEERGVRFKKAVLGLVGKEN